MSNYLWPRERKNISAKTDGAETANIQPSESFPAYGIIFKTETRHAPGLKFYNFAFDKNDNENNFSVAIHWYPQWPYKISREKSLWFVETTNFSPTQFSLFTISYTNSEFNT